MQRIFAAALALGFVGVLAAEPAMAQASAEEKKICLETVKEMTGGKKPEDVKHPDSKLDAVTLCDKGDLNGAIEAAMASGS